MKQFFDKMLKKFKKFCKWIWEECKDWHTLVLLIIVVVIMYTPTWLGVILGAVFKNAWAAGVGAAYAAFWAGPFTPFFPLCIAITFGLKKIMEKHGIFFKKKEKQDNDKKDLES